MYGLLDEIIWFGVVVLGILGLMYVGGPLLIYGTFKLKYPTTVLSFDPKLLRLPEEVSNYIGPAVQQLQSLGFVPVSYFCLPDLVQNVKSICVLLTNEKTLESAMVTCMYGDAGIQTIRSHYVEFVTRFKDGTCVQTNNSRELSAFRPKPKEHTVQFWDTKDARQLYRLHQLVSQQLGSGPRRLSLVEDFQGDVEQFLNRAVIQDPAVYQVEVGLLQRAPDGYSATPKGAFLLTWQELFPFKQVRRSLRKAAAQRWLNQFTAVA